MASSFTEPAMHNRRLTAGPGAQGDGCPLAGRARRRPRWRSTPGISSPCLQYPEVDISCWRVSRAVVGLLAVGRILISRSERNGLSSPTVRVNTGAGVPLHSMQFVQIYEMNGRTGSLVHRVGATTTLGLTVASSRVRLRCGDPTCEEAQIDPRGATCIADPLAMTLLPAAEW